MAITIRSPKTDRLARELAATTGESGTEAVTNALRERLERERAVAQATRQRRRAALQAITIRSPKTDRLARELTATTGESITEAVTNALRERLEGERAVDQATRQRRRAALQAMRAALVGEEVLDPRSDDEILGKFPGPAVDTFAVFLENLDVRVLAFDTHQAAIAFDAYRRFGKGSGHPAQLNLGDCAAYAVARC